MSFHQMNAKVDHHRLNLKLHDDPIHVNMPSESQKHLLLISPPLSPRKCFASHQDDARCSHRLDESERDGKMISTEGSAWVASHLKVSRRTHSRVSHSNRTCFSSSGFPCATCSLLVLLPLHAESMCFLAMSNETSRRS